MLGFGVGLLISCFLVWASGYVGLFLFSYFLSGSIFAGPLYFLWSVATSIWSPVYADSFGCTPNKTNPSSSTLQTSCPASTCCPASTALRPPVPAPVVPAVAEAPPAAHKGRKRPNRLKRRLQGQLAVNGLNPARQVCAPDFPPPAAPRGWDTKVCHFGLQRFESVVICRKHTCSCRSMPRTKWLDPVKKVCSAVTSRDRPCPRFGIFFSGQLMQKGGVLSIACRDAKQRASPLRYTMVLSLQEHNDSQSLYLPFSFSASYQSGIIGCHGSTSGFSC